jgi:hypothetical protein
MFKTGAKILFQDPSADRRLLRSATVAESGSESFSVRFDSKAIALREGDELIAYFHGRREFMQQVVRVIEVAGVGNGPRLGLEPVGDEMSAENRESSRTSALSANVFATLGEDRRLSVEDISATGFAVVSRAQYAVGDTVEVSIGFEGDLFSGAVVVRSVRERGPGTTRYGLHALEVGDLQDGLDQISCALRGKR